MRRWDAAAGERHGRGIGGAVLGLVERRHVPRLEQADVEGELVAQALRHLAIANPDLGLDGATSSGLARSRLVQFRSSTLPLPVWRAPA
jgi:hypothetical protein